MSPFLINFISLAIFTVTLSIGQLLFKQVGPILRAYPLTEEFLAASLSIAH